MKDVVQCRMQIQRMNILTLSFQSCREVGHGGAAHDKHFEKHFEKNGSRLLLCTLFQTRQAFNFKYGMTAFEFQDETKD